MVPVYVDSGVVLSAGLLQVVCHKWLRQRAEPVAGRACERADVERAFHALSLSIVARTLPTACRQRCSVKRGTSLRRALADAKAA